jgi:hypothetical protein
MKKIYEITLKVLVKENSPEKAEIRLTRILKAQSIVVKGQIEVKEVNYT